MLRKEDSQEFNELGICCVCCWWMRFYETSRKAPSEMALLPKKKSVADVGIAPRNMTMENTF